MKRNQTYHQTFFMNVKKNVPWHILAPIAVACDMFLLRASAHHWHVSAFLCNREFQGISYYTTKAPSFDGASAVIRFIYRMSYIHESVIH